MKKMAGIALVFIGALVFVFSVWMYNDHMVTMYESKYFHDLNGDAKYLLFFREYLRQMQTKIGILAFIGISLFLGGYTLLIKDYFNRTYNAKYQRRKNSERDIIK
jgi:drug/metabolite transporter (DMT)-like permease